MNVARPATAPLAARGPGTKDLASGAVPGTPVAFKVRSRVVAAKGAVNFPRGLLGR